MTTSLDAVPVAGSRMRSVVGWAAIDEITQLGPDLQYTIRTEATGLTPRVSRDGFMGLVGIPARLYPMLATQPVTIAWTLATPGYLPRELSVTLGPLPGFPDQFTPAQPVDAGVAGAVMLHRDPIVLRGRVVQLVVHQLDPVPLPGVQVAIAGVWWTFPPAHVDPTTVMQPPNLVALQPGLYASRATGTDSLIDCAMTHVAGQDKTLVASVARGAKTVLISDQIGVPAGTVLAFDPGVPDRTEYIAVTSITGAATPNQPATATLAHRLQVDHDPGAAVWVVTPAPAGTSYAFARDGVRSDAVAFLAGVTGVTAGVVQIGGGTAAVEYQTASLYTATTDSDGYYRLPPLSRVASLKLQTPALSLVTSPDYGRYENLVDVVTP